MEDLIFYADKIMVMGSSKNSRVFNFAILLKSRKFYAREIYMFYGIWQIKFTTQPVIINSQKYYIC